MFVVLQLPEQPSCAGEIKHGGLGRREADIGHAPALIDEIKADAVIADKGYDSDAFFESVEYRYDAFFNGSRYL